MGRGPLLACLVIAVASAGLAGEARAVALSSVTYTAPTGSFYDVRKGLSNDASDYLGAGLAYSGATYSGYPCCASRAASVRAHVTIDPQGDWAPLAFKMRVDCDTYSTQGWIWTYESAITPVAQQDYVDISYPLPDRVDVANFYVMVTLYHDTGGGWDPVGGGMYYAPIYVVQRAPVAPMSTCNWNSVLYYSCRWAAGMTNDDDIANALRNGLFFGGVFAYPNDTATNWMFGSTFRLLALGAGIKAGQRQLRGRVVLLYDRCRLGGRGLQCPRAGSFGRVILHYGLAMLHRKRSHFGVPEPAHGVAVGWLLADRRRELPRGSRSVRPDLLPGDLPRACRRERGHSCNRVPASRTLPADGGVPSQVWCAVTGGSGGGV